MVSSPAQLGVSFAPGTMLGRYELLATIGSGGMASVILARQRGPAGFEKVVVVKVVHPHMAQDPIAVNMLLDEARLAAQIDHPNVVHTYELGEAHGTFYIVMEYLAGESLALVMKEGRARQQPMSPFIAAKIVTDAAEGLHFAHELTDFNGLHLGIVHRDVSPGNIVVQYNGAVKVVDFGIAKANGRVTSTQEGELKGKYGYMAPEQIRNEPMDRRSDVFSLGVVLWEALAQRRLFYADNIAATLMQILSAERIAPSHYAPEIPPSLDAVVLRALAPSAAERYQSVAEFQDAIEDATWQARIGTRDVEAYLASLYREKMLERKGLLARATSGSLSTHDYEQIGTAFREANERANIAQALASASVPQISPRRVHEPTPPPMPVAPEPLRSGPMQATVPAPMLPRPSMFDVPPLLGPNPHGAPTTDGAGYPMLAPMPAPEITGTRVKPWIVIAIVALCAAAAAAAVITATRDEKPAAVVDERSAGEGSARNPEIAVTPIEEPGTPHDAAPTVPTVTEKPPIDRPTIDKPPVDKPPVRPTITEKPAVEKPPVVRPKPPVEVKDPEPKKPAGDPAALVKEASAAYLDGDFATAEAAYRKAIAVNKAYAPAYRGLGLMYERAGKTKKAIEALSTYLKLAPGAKDEGVITKRIQSLGGS